MADTKNLLRRFNPKPVNLIASRAIRDFSKSRRNVVRGILTATEKWNAATHSALRENDLEADMVAAAIAVEAPNALRQRRIVGLRQNEISDMHHFEAKSGRLEAAYASGFLSSWSDLTLKAIQTVELLAQVSEVPTADALGALLETAKAWGASNYLARKIAYFKEFVKLDSDEEAVLFEIDRVIGHKDSPFLQYSCLENLNVSISPFLVSRRHTSIFRDHVRDDFRRTHNLNNVVATPISEDDCGRFILRAVETSLIDTVYAFLVILNLRDRLPAAVSSIERNLRPGLLQGFQSAQRNLSHMRVPSLVSPQLSLIPAKPGEPAEEEERSLSIYRRSAVFLEFPRLCTYRNDIDQVVGHRLIASLLPEKGRWNAPIFDDKEVLKRPDADFDMALHNRPKVRLDTFYRTYLFLRYLQDLSNVAYLSSEEIRYLFDNTTRLETLLLEDELKTMHLNASDEARPLISILALSLYRSKSSDPDVDFDFREKLEEYITSNFNGDIAEFINSLAPSSPDIANYIATSLDDVTLQKMYTIVDSTTKADSIRRDILISLGINLNNIEYIVEAEAIETRAKVSKLKNYFDASRMFVDSIAMKKWLDANPSAYTEQYKESLPKITARISPIGSVRDSRGSERKISFVEFTSTAEYLLEQITKDSFHEFCVNNEFGIESYLGRRIRHNTLSGVMTKVVDDVIQRPEHHPIIAGTPFGKALATWESTFKIFIERMRREFLQFRSDSKPSALFSSVVDFDDAATKRNLLQLVETLKRSGAEMLNDLVISFCWLQIAPQLEAASRHIRVGMAQDVLQSLDYHLQKFNGPEEQKIRSALADGISSIFNQIAGWFQVPETGFVPASIAEICNIIDIEHNRSLNPTWVTSDDEPVRYFGISVHRLYDCLAVLLQNAFKHGEAGSTVSVRFSSSLIEKTNLHFVEVAVRSVLPADDSGECASRVQAATTSSETSRDMVTEGYSGLKKVKFITRLNEGEPTVSYSISNGEIEIRFSLKVEIAAMEAQGV